jgi:hypothetical protein
MAKSHRIEPLLPRLPWLLAYPLQSPLLLMVAGVCFLRLLSHLPSLLGLLFEIVFWVMALKLAVEALTNTAQGRTGSVTGEDLMATDGDAIGQMLLQAGATAALLAALHWGGLAVFVPAALAVLVFLPAATIFLAIDGSLPAALNPLAWFRLIGRLGGAYFGVVAVLALLHGGAWLLQAGFAAVLPGTMSMLPASFITVYVLLVGYHLLGDLLYRYHGVLGLDVAPAVARPRLDTPEEDEAMADAERLARDIGPAAAAARLGQLFRGRGASDAVHDRHRQYLAAAGDVEALLRHDDDYVARLLATGKDRRALAVTLETRRLQTDFLPGRSDDVARLVAQAARAGQESEAAALADDFERRFPGDPAGLDITLATAPLLADRLGRESDAARRLQAALAKFGDHPQAPALREALAQVERLLAITGAAR